MASSSGTRELYLKSGHVEHSGSWLCTRMDVQHARDHLLVFFTPWNVRERFGFLELFRFLLRGCHIV